MFQHSIEYILYRVKGGAEKVLVYCSTRTFYQKHPSYTDPLYTVRYCTVLVHVYFAVVQKLPKKSGINAQVLFAMFGFA